MSQLTEFYRLYNVLITKIHKEILAGNEELQTENTVEEINKRLKEETAVWKDAPLAELGGITPAEFVEKAETLDEVLEIFRTGAQACYTALPYFVLEKLKSFGDDAVKAVEDMAFNLDIAASDMNYLISAVSVKLLGEWKVVRAVRGMIELLKQTADSNEVIAEAVKKALVTIGKPVINDLVEEINKAEKIDEAGEYMMTALSEIGSGARSDEVFSCLKNAFRKMDNKIIGAICLGTYGDGRAIPALRGYAQKNIKNIDRFTFFQIRSEVTKLGGNMDDIMYY